MSLMKAATSFRPLSRGLFFNYAKVWFGTQLEPVFVPFLGDFLSIKLEN